MLSKIKAEQIIVAIAVVAGLTGVIIYYVSGQGSYELQKRQLENSDAAVGEIVVENQPEGQKNVQVNCENGTSYDIYIPLGETSYDAVAASKC